MCLRSSGPGRARDGHEGQRVPFVGFEELADRGDVRGEVVDDRRGHLAAAGLVHAVGEHQRLGHRAAQVADPQLGDGREQTGGNASPRPTGLDRAPCSGAKHAAIGVVQREQCDELFAEISSIASVERC